MGMQNFIKKIPKGSRDRASFTFFRIWTSAKPRPIPNVICLPYGLHHVNINVYAKFHHHIFHSVQEIGPFSLFQNLELGKASTDEKCHFAISWARYCQYQCLCKSLSKYSTEFKRYGYFHFFSIWRSAKPRPMINVISQSLGLDVVNINMYAKFYQNIPNGLRVIDIFHEQAVDKIFTNCPVTIKCSIIGNTMSQPSVSVDFLRVVQFLYANSVDPDQTLADISLHCLPWRTNGLNKLLTFSWFLSSSSLFSFPNI